MHHRAVIAPSSVALDHAPLIQVCEKTEQELLSPPFWKRRETGINLVCYQIQTYGSLPPKRQCPNPLSIHTESRKSHRFFRSTGVRTGWSFLCFVKWDLSSFGFASAFHTQNRNSIFLLGYSSHQNLYFGFIFTLYRTLRFKTEIQ